VTCRDPPTYRQELFYVMHFWKHADLVVASVQPIFSGAACDEHAAVSMRPAETVPEKTIHYRFGPELL